MFNYRRKKRSVWSDIRKKAPKVPDITCHDIDTVLKIVEDHIENGKVIKKTQKKKIDRLMEKLRTANEKLRDSGVYWHDQAKDLCKKFID